MRNDSFLVGVVGGAVGEVWLMAELMLLWGAPRRWLRRSRLRRKLLSDKPLLFFCRWLIESLLYIFLDSHSFVLRSSLPASFLPLPSLEAFLNLFPASSDRNKEATPPLELNTQHLLEFLK